MNSLATTGQQGPDEAFTADDPGRVQDLPWWARTRGFGWVLLVCGVGSFYGAVELTLERIQLYINPDHIAACDVGGAFSCSTVMKSAQATVFGPPNPFIGLVGFTILIVVGVVLTTGTRLPRWFMNMNLLGTAAATGFLVWLYTQAVYEIGSLCLYCMVCWFFMGLLLPVHLARNILTNDLPAPRWLRGWAQHGAWLTSFILLVACAASIVVVFSNQFFG
ncbi:vitamin K epoxide reductase family protein [Pseudoglutamicibacter albus]|uniref:vitamin K epoxide reductase family protein n=1 Tax=Pseudoglutamicibacter albus TaxID=98671 RepID=UPI000C788E6A|nr:vitamin K epoxide reductase family protein [Pseudoglutamicibacter albus]PKY80983.1 hypothetical protein CYJ35_00580 [Pseudoglutamicibacter albus]WIK84378.1 vitamin K epoxide reductase family protein [Pseudoglutamicibacter albus]